LTEIYTLYELDKHIGRTNVKLYDYASEAQASINTLRTGDADMRF